MHAASCFVQPFCPPKSAIKKIRDFPASAAKPATSRAHASPVKAALSFNYNSAFSVFPAEACETIGGDACAATMFPEAKLNTRVGSSKTTTTTTLEEVDQEYFDYDSEPNSVLREEACDDLGGEFSVAS